MPESDKELPRFPSDEQFQAMAVNDKVKLFTSLPIPVQKVLVACSAFRSTVDPKMAQPVSRTNEEDFIEAQKFLVDTPFFSMTETGRFQILGSMRDFINKDLMRIWADQQSRQRKRK